MEETTQKKWQIRFSSGQYSRLGMASFLIAILAAITVIVDISLGMHAKTAPVTAPAYQALDVWLTWLTALLALAGIVVGVAAVLQKQKKRLFGLIGLIVNGLFLLAVFALYLVNAIGFWRLASRS